MDSEHEEEESDKWVKGKGCSSEERINIFSLNGFGEPVFTGGRYQPDEIQTLTQAVSDYCSEKQVSVTELCGGYDHIFLTLVLQRGDRIVHKEEIGVQESV